MDKHETPQGLKCWLLKGRVHYPLKGPDEVHYYVWANSAEHAERRIRMPLAPFADRGVWLQVDRCVLDPDPPSGPTSAELAQLASEGVN